MTHILFRHLKDFYIPSSTPLNIDSRYLLFLWNLNVCELNKKDKYIQFKFILDHNKKTYESLKTNYQNAIEAPYHQTRPKLFVLSPFLSWLVIIDIFIVFMLFSHLWLSCLKVNVYNVRTCFWHKNQVNVLFWKCILLQNHNRFRDFIIQWTNFVFTLWNIAEECQIILVQIRFHGDDIFFANNNQLKTIITTYPRWIPVLQLLYPTGKTTRYVLSSEIT